MRPLRLELSGFTSFREPTEIDFRDADLFVLTGPMGAGKSSIIDAMSFALYGSVARLQNLAMVAPIISQGLTEARVRLDFLLDGTEYSAVRVVRRTRTGGATTAEARLLCGETLIEGAAEQVSQRVAKLIGLNFDQFNRCVVLPQGEFASLLHAKAADRQELLVQLLDIGLYRRVGAAARKRVELINERSEPLKQRLERDLLQATPEAYDQIETRLVALVALEKKLTSEQEALDAVTRQVAERKLAVQQVEQVIEKLQVIHVPEGLRDLAGQVTAAKDAAEAARKDLDQVNESLAALQVTRSKLPELALVKQTLERYAERVRNSEGLAATEKQLASATEDLKNAQQAVEKAGAARDHSEAEVRRLERAHSAYHAAAGLKPGDPCPVCGDVLTEVPAVHEPEGLAEAEAALKDALRQLRDAEAARDDVSKQHVRLQATFDTRRDTLKQLEDYLKKQPSEEDCKKLLVAIDKAEKDLSAAKNAQAKAQVAARRADEALRGYDNLEKTAWTSFHTVRDEVAALGAPAVGTELAATWQALSVWAQDELSKRASVRDEAERERAQLQAKAETMRAAMVVACEAAGVKVNGGSPRDAALTLKVRTEEELRQLDNKLAERGTVEQELARLQDTSKVAGVLGYHLNATRFERWYLEEALTSLVEGATERLNELSDGQYSLALNRNKTDFIVIDHLNLDEERSVRTLSGGETFLASLALALALGDNIASLATNGGARLDALFLDEGFGSLDANTLETVSSAIEEMGARGRMVGIITHVPELADRIPVKFQVAKEGRASTVRRLEAV